MLLQQQPRSSEIYREIVYDLERKKKVSCKITTIVGSRVGDCYKKVVPRFRVEWD